MNQPLITDGSEEDLEELERMSLFEHLEELRSRLFWCVGALVVGVIVCFAFAEHIFAILRRPAAPYIETLTVLGPQDGFMMALKVSLLAAIFVTSPFLIFQIWKFISPGLYRREKLYAIPFIFFASGFFLAGGLFAYTVALPFGLEFLVYFGNRMGLEAEWTIDRYVNFVLPITLGLGIMFELPILIFMLSQLGIVTPRFLMKHFRWAVLIVFTVSAIITPTPDIFNLMVVALPTLALYLLGVGAAALAGGGRKRDE